MTRPPRNRYFAARLVLPPNLEDLAVGACWEAGCLGVEVAPAARPKRGRRVILRVWFPGRGARRPLARRLARTLREGGLGEMRISPLRIVPDAGWARSFRRTLKPMRIGRRLLVVPEGARRPRRTGGRVVIRVRFGQAFGTGEHPTTRLSLRLLESCLKPADRVLDLGTGTGILAVAARLLGARRVLAVDNDPVALKVAAETLADNRAVAGVTLHLADAGAPCRRGRFELALVNIGATAIRLLLPRLARFLAPGGRAILAGFLVEDAAPLKVEARRLGLRPQAELRSRPWAALLLRRPLR